MKKLILFTSLVLIVSCKKEDSVKPCKATPGISLPEKPIDQLLTGSWIMTTEIVEGPLVHINHLVAPDTIVITPTYWVNPTFSLSISGHTLIIPVYHRFGSDSTWQINFSDHNNFTLNNSVTSGFYNGTSITDSYQKVN